jgi:hypothetical protein
VIRVVWKVASTADTRAGREGAVLVLLLASQATRLESVFLLTAKSVSSQLASYLCLCVVVGDATLDFFAELVKVFPRAGHRRRRRESRPGSIEL